MMEQNSSNKRITVIVGAGAIHEIGGAQTDNITKAVRYIKCDILGEIITTLDEYYDPIKINFEDIFHAVEMLLAYSPQWGGNSAKYYDKDFMICLAAVKQSYTQEEIAYKEKASYPVIGAFAEPKCSMLFNFPKLIKLQETIISTVTDKVFEQSKLDLNGDKNRWFNSFWKDLSDKNPLDICVLNYDNYLERCIDNYTDGFDSGNACNKFNPQSIINIDKIKHRVMHIHGSCLFGNWSGVCTDSMQSEPSKESYEEIYKYSCYETAKVNQLKPNATQSKETQLITPIITGLRKTEKVIYPPFSFYSYLLHKAIIENSSLLVIGYSFNDIYLNAIIERITQLHDRNRRIVFIDCLKDKKGEIKNINLGMKNFLENATDQTDPLKNYASNKNYAESDDKCARMYINGFKNTIDNDKQGIINFLI